FIVFTRAPDALAAAADAQHALFAHLWPDGAVVRVRMGLHTGTPLPVGSGYVGLDVHRAARIGAAAHGGQALLSSVTVELVRDALPAGSSLRDLGQQHLKDMPHHERLFQLILPNLPAEFPPLRALEHQAHNLPAQPTPLLGREREAAAIHALLLRED